MHPSQRAFFQPFRSLASFWVRHADIEIAKGQISDIVNLREESNRDAPCLPEEIQGRIVLNNISYTPDGSDEKVFEGLNLLVEDGKMVCINTDSERLPTLLLNLIYGLNQPDNGQVFIDGNDLSEFCHSDYQGRMEYIPQQGTLFNGTIYENLTLLIRPTGR